MTGALENLRRLRRDDEGFTLVELLVTMILFGILTTVLFSVVMNSANTLTTVRQTTDLNEESRLTLNRMSRELREASSIFAVVNPDGYPCHATPPCATVGITFDVDFNGVGGIEPNAADPERLTYTFNQSDKQITLTTGSTTPPATPLTFPILASNVESFKLTFASQKFQCDANFDGVVSWQEIDAGGGTCPSTLGNQNGLLDLELSSVNSITIELTVLTGSRRQEYRTQLDLRNRPI